MQSYFAEVKNPSPLGTSVSCDTVHVPPLEIASCPASALIVNPSVGFGLRPSQ